MTVEELDVMFDKRVRE